MLRIYIHSSQWTNIFNHSTSLLRTSRRVAACGVAEHSGSGFFLPTHLPLAGRFAMQRRAERHRVAIGIRLQGSFWLQYVR